jgi:ElaB/YqjD/DUF883 family membrane-anchored ribosome-binding protein
MAENYKSMSKSVDSVADTAADLASQAASQMSDVAAQAQKKVTSYLREHDTQEMLADLRAYVKAHPTQALIGAAAFGFLAAALLRRR